MYDMGYKRLLIGEVEYWSVFIGTNEEDITGGKLPSIKNDGRLTPAIIEKEMTKLKNEELIVSDFQFCKVVDKSARLVANLAAENKNTIHFTKKKVHPSVTAALKKACPFAQISTKKE